MATRKRGRPIKRVQPKVQAESVAEVREPYEDDDLEELDHGPSVHASRDQEYPSEEPVRDEPEDAWSPPSLLEAPPPRPGYTQRWIRIRKGAADDWRNYNSRFREGWRPRPPSTVPRDYGVPTEAHGKFGDAIIVEGMMLCEMPLARAKQRQEYYDRKLAAQTQAIDEQLLKVQQPGHPIARESKTHVTVGVRRPNVQADE